jgi:hypothetical protein
LKKKKLAFIVIPTLIVIVVALLLVSLPLQPLGKSSLASSSIPSPPPSCGRQLEVWGPAYGYGSNGSSSSLVPVLLMQPNETGYICVTYQSVNGSSSNNANPLSGWGISKADCGAAGACVYVPSYSFNIDKTIVNSTLPFVGNATVQYVSIIYSVRALGNSTGFYDQSAPLQHCDSLPLAVGYSASQLNASDFPGFINPELLNCPLIQYAPVEVGVIGMQMTNVEFPKFP